MICALLCSGVTGVVVGDASGGRGLLCVLCVLFRWDCIAVVVLVEECMLRVDCYKL